MSAEDAGSSGDFESHLEQFSYNARVTHSLTYHTLYSHHTHTSTHTHTPTLANMGAFIFVFFILLPAEENA